MRGARSRLRSAGLERYMQARSRTLANRAVSSVVERLVYTEDVGSSTLSPPTSFPTGTSCEKHHYIRCCSIDGRARRGAPWALGACAPYVPSRSAKKFGEDLDDHQHVPGVGAGVSAHPEGARRHPRQSGGLCRRAQDRPGGADRGAARPRHVHAGPPGAARLRPRQGLPGASRRRAGAELRRHREDVPRAEGAHRTRRSTSSAP